MAPSFPPPSPFRLRPSFRVLHRFFQLADIVERELSRRGQLRHERLRTTAKEAQNVIKHARSRDVPRHEWLENVRVADLSHATYEVLALHSVHRRGDGGVGRTRFGKGFLDLAERRAALRP